MKRLIKSILWYGAFALAGMLIAIGQSYAASSPQLVPLQMAPDSLGHTTTNIPNASRYVTQYTLVANTATTITVPTGANWILLAPTANLWVNFSGGTATVPVGDIHQGSGSFFNPPMTYIGPVYSGGVAAYPALTTISVISDSSWVLTVMWWR